MPKIIASAHAIKRFRQRANRKSDTDEEIKKELEAAAGTVRDGQYEIRYCGLLLCVIRDTITTVVLPNMLEARTRHKNQRQGRKLKYIRGKKTYN